MYRIATAGNLRDNQADLVANSNNCVVGRKTCCYSPPKVPLRDLRARVRLGELVPWTAQSLQEASSASLCPPAPASLAMLAQSGGIPASSFVGR